MFSLDLILQKWGANFPQGDVDGKPRGSLIKLSKAEGV